MVRFVDFDTYRNMSGDNFDHSFSSSLSSLYINSASVDTDTK